MGSFHGAEVCDLVGLYILDKLKSIFDNCGLYRDDGLGVIDLLKPLVYEKIKKSTFRLMSDTSFKITLEIGAQKTNFLYVTLNLSWIQLYFTFFLNIAALFYFFSML